MAVGSLLCPRSPWNSTGKSGLPRGHLGPLNRLFRLAHMLEGSWVSTLLTSTMKETLRLVRACPHGFPHLSLCPWVSQSCTPASGLRVSNCRLHSCGSNEVKEQTVPVYSPPGSDVLCSINNLVRWTELDWSPPPKSIYKMITVSGYFWVVQQGRGGAFRLKIKTALLIQNYCGEGYVNQGGDLALTFLLQ